MRYSLTGCSISMILFGPSLTPWQAIISRFLSGLLGAGIFVPGVRLISSSFSLEERGRALGFFSIGGSVGLILAAWVTPLTSSSVGWKAAMILYGLVGCFITFVIWRMSSTQNPKKDGELAVEAGSTKRSLGASFWILALAQFVRLGSNYTFIAWLPLVLQEDYGLDMLAAGVFISLFNFAGVVSNPLGGFFSDRVGEKTVLIISFYALALSMLGFIYVHVSPILGVIVFLIGWFTNFLRSPSFSVIPKMYGAERAGRMSGVLNTFASVGSLALPFFLGYVRDTASSYFIGWMSLILLVLLAASTCFLLKVPTGMSIHR